MIDARITALFFDKPKVIRAVDKATRKVLSLFGRNVRQRARKSIVKRKRISKAGSPPSSHKGQLRKFLFFSYEPKAQNVVIGPAALGRATAPAALEYGGRVRRYGASMTYAARPFMGPAFETEKPTLPELWADSVH